jgi:hypothetical protein
LKVKVTAMEVRVLAQAADDKLVMVTAAAAWLARALRKKRVSAIKARRDQ